MPLLQELGDGSRGIIPFSIQDEFHSLPDNIKNALFGGAIGGGKTDTLISLPLVRRFYEAPGFQGIILRPTSPQLQAEIIPRTKALYPHFGGAFNEQKKSWTFPSGARIICGYADSYKKIQDYDGVEFQLVMFDEIQKFDKKVVDFLMIQRLRGKITGPAGPVPLIGRHSGMPGGKGHAWVANKFGLKKFPHGRKVLKDDKGETCIYIPSKIENNPYVNADYTRQLEQLDAGLFEARRYGNWGAMSGNVFTSFRQERMQDEPENALHIYDPFRIPDEWPRFVSVDPGTAAYAFIIWWAIDPARGVAWIYRTHAVKGYTTQQWATQAKILNKGDKIEFAVMDTAAFSRVGEDSTTAATFRKYFGAQCIRAVKDRVSGKNALLELLRWEPLPVQERKMFDPKECWDIFQKLGRKAAFEYEMQHPKAVDQENLPRLRVFRRSPEGIPNDLLIDTIQTRERDEHNIEDVMETEDDDGYDSVRYGANAFLDRMAGRLEGMIKKTISILQTPPTTEAQMRHLNHQAHAHPEVRRAITGESHAGKVKLDGRGKKLKRRRTPKWMKPWKGKERELLDSIRPN